MKLIFRKKLNNYYIKSQPFENNFLESIVEIDDDNYEIHMTRNDNLQYEATVNLNLTTDTMNKKVYIFHEDEYLILTLSEILTNPLFFSNVSILIENNEASFEDLHYPEFLILNSNYSVKHQQIKLDIVDNFWYIISKQHITTEFNSQYTAEEFNKTVMQSRIDITHFAKQEITVPENERVYLSQPIFSLNTQDNTELLDFYINEGVDKRTALLEFLTMTEQYIDSIDYDNRIVHLKKVKDRYKNMIDKKVFIELNESSNNSLKVDEIEINSNISNFGTVSQARFNQDASLYHVFYDYGGHHIQKSAFNYYNNEIAYFNDEEFRTIKDMNKEQTRKIQQSSEIDINISTINLTNEIVNNSEKFRDYLKLKPGNLIEFVLFDEVLECMIESVNEVIYKEVVVLSALEVPIEKSLTVRLRNRRKIQK